MRKGTKMTAEARQKMSDVHKGKTTWNKGIPNTWYNPKGLALGHGWNKGIKGLGVGEKNGNWKGDKVGREGLHLWLRRQLGEPTSCQHCSKTGLTRHQIHWANKSNKYFRKLWDWMRLCASCHKKYDTAFKDLVLRNNL